MNVALRTEHLNLISICSGGAGLDLGLELAIPSARSVCMVEREAFAVASLVAAMEQGLLHPAPVWSDARTFDGRAWRGAVDGLIGGIPCQPHSLAGRKQGSHDARDLWSTARRIIVQSGAWFVVIENVGGMLSAGADEIAGAQRVFRDLHKLGFEVEEDCSRRQKSARAISASASSSSQWPTPATRDHHAQGATHNKAAQSSSLAAVVEKEWQASAWPTPTANDWKGSGPTLERKDGQMRGDRLDYATEQLWSTPRASDAEKGGPNQAFGADGQPLPSQAAQWATPRVAANRTSTIAMVRPDSVSSLSLEQQAETLAGITPIEVTRSEKLLKRFGLSSPQGPTAEVNGEPSSTDRRSLNPLFVEWLMGWPPGWTLVAWTDFACSATELSLFKQRMRSALSSLGLPREAPPAQLALFG